MLWQHILIGSQGMVLSGTEHQSDCEDKLLALIWVPVSLAAPSTVLCDYQAFATATLIT